MAVPQYLSWSSTPITFDRDDHLDKVVAPGVYPLVVDPIIVNTRLSKVLMDSGSSLNIIYLETLDLIGINRAQAPVASMVSFLEKGVTGRSNRPTGLLWHGGQLQKGDPHF